MDTGKPETSDPGWIRIKRKQARDADNLAAVASGIGQFGIANACYKLAGILRQQAREMSEHPASVVHIEDTDASNSGDDAS